MKLVALVVAMVGLPATAVEAQQPPTPEQIQAWATTLPRQPTSGFDPVYSPIDVIHVLDRNYAVILRDFAEQDPGDAWTKAGEGSKTVDRFRRALVHSPDRSFNRLVNNALNKIGDVFDEVNNTQTGLAATDALRSNRLWSEVEVTLKGYGVDTGVPWSMSTAH